MALLMHCLYCVFVAWFFLQLYAFYGLETYFGCVILENSTVYEISNTSKYFEIQYSIRMIKERAWIVLLFDSEENIHHRTFEI